MKTRIGFVSNSSSASFVIAVNCLTEDQYDALAVRSEEIGWSIRRANGLVDGSTTMDNGEMEILMDELGIDTYCARWFSEG